MIVDIYIYIFAIFAIWFLTTYKYMNNMNFVIMCTFFFAYLYKLTNTTSIESYEDTKQYMCPQWSLNSIDRWLQAPMKIKDMFGNEIDQLVNVIKGAKGPDGEYIKEEVVDGTEQKRYEMFMIDKVIRELAMVDPVLYQKIVWTV